MKQRLILKPVLFGFFFIFSVFTIYNLDYLYEYVFGQAVMYEALQNNPTTVYGPDVCKTVTYTGSGSIMIPTRTSAEWSTFRSNLPANTSLSDDCFCPFGCVEPTPQNAPTNLTLSVWSLGGIKLDWTAPAGGGGITGYRVQRRPGAGGAWVTVVADTGSTNTTYTNTGLTENTEYEYQVAAINQAGVGPYSTAVKRFTGHCYVATTNCNSGYTSIVGGTQSGCASVGPVNSPYPGNAAYRYRVFSTGTNSSCGVCPSSVGVTHTRVASFSTNSGSSYTNSGTAQNCQTSGTHNCAWAPRETGQNYVYSCSGARSCGHCDHTPLCTNNTGCAVCAIAQTCTNLETTIRWCCRS